ncbi:MAG: EpsI family protein [Candidatus Brocadiaceae bacterium]|nr:EpsI family protein [Candidatus Brocadiaceae bacterium]
MTKTKIEFNIRYFIVIALLAGAIFYSQLRSDGKPVPITKSLEGFPIQIDGWSGKAHKFSQNVYDILGVDDSVLIDYENGKNKKVSMYVGYYESQKQGEIIHSPKNCMLGSGWQPIEISEIKISSDSGKIPVMKMIVGKHSQKQVVLYWYQSGNRAVANEYFQRLYFIHDSIRYNRTNAAFIRFISPVSGDDYEGSLQLLTNFIKKIMPTLNEYLPKS